MSNRNSTRRPATGPDEIRSLPVRAARKTSPTTEIPARDLRPGDIVVKEDGSRAYAAFDVSADEYGVTVWTAVPDQEAGQPDKVFLDPEEPVRVRSARPVPGVSRITLADAPVVLPPFYGSPIDTPAGYRWAGYRETLRCTAVVAGKPCDSAYRVQETDQGLRCNSHA